MSVRRFSCGSFSVLGFALAVLARTASAVCVGDCDAGGEVAINEVQACVNQFLSTQPAVACCDQNHNGTVEINEVQGAVNSFLNPATCPMLTPVAMATPTPTPPAGGLGVRVFSIVPNVPSCVPTPGVNLCGSAFFNSFVSGMDISCVSDLCGGAEWGSGPLRLVAGVPDANGVASLTLQEDVVLGFRTIEPSIVCVSISAAGMPPGSIDCNGGSPHDVRVTLNSNGASPGSPALVETGLGVDGGPGAASFRVTIAAARIADPELPLSACASVPQSEFLPIQTAFTTRIGTGILTNPLQGGTRPVSLGKQGQNFSCATWTMENAVGVMVAPLPTEDAPIIIADVVSILQVADK